MSVIEKIVPVVSAVLQLGAFGALVVEIAASQLLWRWYLALPGSRLGPPGDLPVVLDPTRLHGLEGEDGAVRFAWADGRLWFGRRLWRGGERGHLVGWVRFGADGGPEVRWRPSPVVFAPMIVGFGALGAVWFVAVEGQWAAVSIVPATLLAALALWWAQGNAARRILERTVLPALSRAVRSRLDS